MVERNTQADAETSVDDPDEWPEPSAAVAPANVPEAQVGARVESHERRVEGERDHAMLLADREQFFERQDHATSAGRLRRLLPLAMLLWMGFFVVDAVLAKWVVPSDLLPYLLLRSVGLIPLGVAWWRLHGRLPSPGELKVLDLSMTASCAGLLSGMCLLSGGLLSPYNAYLPLVLIGRAAVLPNHWKEGALRLGVPALLHPMVLGLGALLSEPIAVQFSTASGSGTFFFYLMLLGGAWLLLVIGGHNVWALRRQVFRSRSIGRYRLEERIGRGGMGEIWVAFDDQLQRQVALKILRPDSGTDPIAIGRFKREIMATAALAHPNTVRIYDHGVTDDGLWYYAMELLSGRDLKSLVRLEGPLPAARVIKLMRQAGRALAEAHRQGIIHRDIKPDNLFITDLGGERDFVKVLDFGIARADHLDSDLTSTGMMAGTPGYAAPEVVLGGSADARSDVYGLGGTLYFALTATKPFSAATAQAMFRAHLHQPLERPSQRLGRSVPADLEAVVIQAMAKSPADRHADAGELAAALDACLSPTAHRRAETRSL
jgi:eukaryotic-like serine/threonine-protein kinase